MKYRYLAVALLLSTIAALALAQGYPIQITSVTTKDMTGVERNTFSRGEIVVVETELTCPSAYYYYAPGGYSYLEIITMWYGNSMLNIVLTRDTIMAGETKIFGGGMFIRYSDPLGTYNIEVYVWNGFPSEMGAAWAPLADIATTSITVTP
ncbi:MAG: hypothetical protein DRK00_06290 [Thermoprotei archaeon]|nr:MAG: hypothetical protein DRK00_06290 [Thermoprotei archaeon]